MLLVISACTARQPITRIALLAPFEGRYREVGYNALYAARLALQDANIRHIELLPVDDGGGVTSAADRARALAEDDLVQAALILGYAAADPAVQAAFADIPVIIVGHWSSQPAADTVFMLANAALASEITAPPAVSVTAAADLPVPVTGGEVFALAQFPILRSDLTGIRIVTSAAPPDAIFAHRYRASDQFAPQPGLLASLTYDAARMTVQAVQSSTSRAGVVQTLNRLEYDGLNGLIRFEDGYWHNAPVNYFTYDADNRLQPANHDSESP